MVLYRYMSLNSNKLRHEEGARHGRIIVKHVFSRTCLCWDMVSLNKQEIGEDIPTINVVLFHSARLSMQ